ncbi:putative pentatricopeptide repeat-containing protein [Forsythia ovata]|uniref:Pentatricopeptide repeat-containing protein n=1 Tax=Forsythia ovata TaxID=205694 RepID=A0ABD1X0S1_9LAMI
MSIYWFLKRMTRGSIVGRDKYTFPSLIKACSNALALREGRIIHGVSVRHGTEDDVFVGSSLIDLYGKCAQVFDGMRVTNEVSWTQPMVVYLNFGDLLKVDINTSCHFST